MKLQEVAPVVDIITGFSTTVVLSIATMLRYMTMEIPMCSLRYKKLICLATILLL